MTTRLNMSPEYDTSKAPRFTPAQPKRLRGLRDFAVSVAARSATVAVAVVRSSEVAILLEQIVERLSRTGRAGAGRSRRLRLTLDGRARLELGTFVPRILGRDADA